MSELRQETGTRMLAWHLADESEVLEISGSPQRGWTWTPREGLDGWDQEN
jgi:hypothetical protein